MKGEQMNKRELADAVAESTGLSRSQAEGAVEAVAEAISKALAAGDKVTVPGFGTFDVRERAARTGRNPQTGESMDIAASRSAGFKPATALKQALNG
ncbi:HU family DNA-binding protein [Nocardioides sp. S-58]|uniref:HU family DNA-binding protein n=1 Tax=Nocardioides renjunii TaxID=3095075 RepID=A0ABU5KBD5_9ACTN|nr:MULTISPECIES: HU family DNA-binding protein [unclassified Nocardioides]MDZ5661735.1 HU family DNA-binding protein [Nocardioides sp. S-58]WQQ24418.1 HU family DNA-binding protein [Nocardioides sp. S-34]